jgi:hypothetical protein
MWLIIFFYYQSSIVYLLLTCDKYTILRKCIENIEIARKEGNASKKVSKKSKKIGSVYKA